MLNLVVSILLGLVPPAPLPPEDEPLPADGFESFELYEWVMIGQLPDGAWLVVAAKKYSGQGDDSCAVRAIENEDGTLRELLCSGMPECKALSKDCQKSERKFGDELIMVMCHCLKERPE